MAIHTDILDHLVPSVFPDGESFEDHLYEYDADGYWVVVHVDANRPTPWLAVWIDEEGTLHTARCATRGKAITLAESSWGR